MLKQTEACAQAVLTDPRWAAVVAHDAQAQQAWQDIGPSFGYKLRDAAGQATEFHIRFTHAA